MNKKHRENIVLFGVLNHEVAFSSYFCNLLKIDKFREIFIDFINEKNEILSNKKLIKYNNFNTEIILKNNYGRVDLFLEINNQEFIFEIKHKLYTKLSDNQPHNYLKYLENKNEHLFFLVPKGYRYIQEIVNRWKNYYDEHKIKNQIFYWQDFIYKIKDIKIVEIQMFYEFCELWFNMKPIIFDDNEKKIFHGKGIIVKESNNIYIPKLMKKLTKVVEQIGSNINMKPYTVSTEGFYYTKKIGDYELSFGIDYDYWEHTGTPLAIIIQNYKNGYDDFDLNIKNDDIQLEKFLTTYFGFCVNIKGVLLHDNYQNIIENKLLLIERELKKLHIKKP